MTEKEVQQQSAKRTRRSFLVAGVAAAAGYEFYRWIEHAPGDETIQRPLRKALNLNQAVSRTVFDERGLAPTYDRSQAKELRINGNFGLKQDLLPESYRLQVVGVENASAHPKYVADVTAWNYRYKAEAAKYEGHDTKEAPRVDGGNAGPAKDMSAQSASGGDRPAAPVAKPDGGAQSLGPKPNPAEGPGPDMSPQFAAAFAAAQKANSDGRPMRGQEEAGESDSTLDPDTPGLLLEMADINRLPAHQMVTQFKCIEGWSEIVEWSGVRLADFLDAYPPAKNAQGKLPRYVYMETPNGDYYCGFDLNECMHPQSLLVTGMSGRPLTQAHGSPLRLHMPIKYGYKQIKRIGLIAYTDLKPDDYWTKLGYDWYAGL